jgi:hypothetical protein
MDLINDCNSSTNRFYSNRRPSVFDSVKIYGLRIFDFLFFEEFLFLAPSNNRLAKIIVCAHKFLSVIVLTEK